MIRDSLWWENRKIKVHALRNKRNNRGILRIWRQRKDLDYSVLHKLDSPANRLIRQSIWGDQDIGQQSFITPWYREHRPTHIIFVIF
ncbi:MAG: hypothetical protein C4291_14685 [Candidatus Dadabacteria bacterium]